MSMKEDDNKHQSMGRRISKKRKTKEPRYLCFPWTCKPELSDHFHRKRTVPKTNGVRINGYQKRHFKDPKTNGYSKRNTKVSWDDDITVRYINGTSSTELLKKKIKKKVKEELRKYTSDPSTENESPNEDDAKNDAEDDAKDVVHVKIRIPKRTKKSESNVIDILGQNTDADIGENDNYSKEGYVNMVSIGNSLDGQYGKVEMRSDVSSSYIKRANDEKNSKENFNNPVSVFKKKSKMLGMDTKGKTLKNSVKSTQTLEEYRDEAILAPSIKAENYGCEADRVVVDPITMVEVPGIPGDQGFVGIPLKEPGKSSCGSEGCACKGSNKNDQNFVNLKKAISISDSDSMLLNKAIEMKSESDEMNVLTDMGMINVVCHNSRCSCAVCETFGSRGGQPNRSSIRSDTGAVVSKKIVRVSHNSAFRNVLTHTEECGCDICMAIEEETFRNKARRSTRISTKDSILTVENKGVCGCKNCKTVKISRPSQDEKAIISMAKTGQVDPCVYSDATIPSINSFPRSHLGRNQEGTTSSSFDSSESNMKINTNTRLNNHNKQLNPSVDQNVQSKRMIKHHGEGNKSTSMVPSYFSIPTKYKRRTSDQKQLDDVQAPESVRNNRLCQCPRCSVDVWVTTEEHPAKHGTRPSKSKSKPMGRHEEYNVENKEYEQGLEKLIDCGNNKESFSKKLRKKIPTKKEKLLEIPKKKSKKHTDVKSRGQDSARQTTLEDIIKDLITGQTIDDRDKSYTVTLGKIHDRAFTKVKIVDCSKPKVESFTSAASAESSKPPTISQDLSSGSADVYFLKPISSLSVSPTHSSNFAKSNESYITRSNHFTNHYRLSAPDRYANPLVVSPSPSFVLISPVADYMQIPNSIADPGVSFNTEDLCNTRALHPGLDTWSPPTKKSKFTIKFNGKLGALFKKCSKKKAKSLSIEDKLASGS